VTVASDDGREIITREMTVAPSLHPRAEESFALYAVHGSAAGAVFKIDRDTLLLGRNHSAQLRIDDEGVSRVHARFDRSGGSVSVTDLQSKNGTFINGERITETQGLLDGDQIALGTCVLRFAVQTSAEIALAQQVYDASVRDHLTGLYNRRYAEEQLKHALKSPSMGFHTACMLHVDGLADVNDREGRAMGDELLRNVASKLQSVLGEEDLIARWDGAELLIVSREPDADVLGARLRALVSSVQVPSSGGAQNAKASAGVTLLRARATSGQVLASVESSLDEALRAGGDRCCVHFETPFNAPEAAEPFSGGFTVPMHTEQMFGPGGPPPLPPPLPKR
jgi:two-component system cell cycle response regulator